MVSVKTPEPPKFGSLLNFVWEGVAAMSFCPSDFTNDTSVGLRDSVPCSQVFEKPPRSRHTGMETVWPSPSALSHSVMGLEELVPESAPALAPEFAPDTLEGSH